MSEKVDAEAPAAISVLDKEAIAETPGVNLDDRLRAVPGFSLFRRSSSVAANPTTQGISLRGIGSTGASRTLVLWDGIPVNDPFGGWIYWTRIAPEELDRAEVSRGAATSLFGDLAMSGAISLFSRSPERYHFAASYDGGMEGTNELGVSASNVWRNWAASISGRAFRTDGYYIVPPSIRGKADTRAGVEFVAGAAAIDWIHGVQRLALKLDILAEDRANGTVLQENSTSLGTLSANYLGDFGHNTISLIAFHTREQFHSSYTAVAAGRNTERLTTLQTVPAEQAGGAAFWRRSESRWHLLAGADVNRVEGYSTDRGFPTGVKVSGGTILQHGLFAQGDVEFGPARFFAGLRHTFAGDGNTFVSPSGGVVIGKGLLRGRASIYRSFRAPTLNELYRDFRVGNTNTLANALLRPETSFGSEIGLDLGGERSRLSVTAYRNSLDSVITNVTLSQTATAIVRQRRNAGSVLARGVETTFQQALLTYWQFHAGYLFADSRYSTGERVPQIPRSQGSAQLIFERGATLISGGLRGYSSQFDDDRNQFLLPGFATLQLTARQKLGRGVSANLAIENLLDRRFYVAFTPTPNIGAPFLWRAGIRWEGKLR